MKLTPSRLKRFLNLYPPYLGAGIRVAYISEDWRELHVSMSLRWFNRNAVGTHFGGSLYAMVDPHVMLLLMRLLGDDYWVWDKSAEIEFVKASKVKVSARIKISDSDLNGIRLKTREGKKFFPEFVIEIMDDDNALVARVRKTLYIRRKAGRRQ